MNFDVLFAFICCSTCGFRIFIIFSISLCVQVEFFEPFWDSGEPRIGERGARGWNAWMLQQERGGWVIPPEPGFQIKQTRIDDVDNWKLSCTLEPMLNSKTLKFVIYSKS